VQKVLFPAGCSQPGNCEKRGNKEMSMLAAGLRKMALKKLRNEALSRKRFRAFCIAEAQLHSNQSTRDWL